MTITLWNYSRIYLFINSSMNWPLVWQSMSSIGKSSSLLTSLMWKIKLLVLGRLDNISRQIYYEAIHGRSTVSAAQFVSLHAIRFEDELIEFSTFFLFIFWHTLFFNWQMSSCLWLSLKFMILEGLSEYWN